ncbi:hypothetical protein [uncultured Methanobrevibacter sp.]|uniref:hypothetical protein n=1 Tax=uncultured Methanobrevibacter sp. TaxID=253161 RepID=UPI0025F6743B|nr:hypothetical protein [uncultured Methanobrevibacter sp.]
MSGKITKAQEIKRLTTPLTFKDSKAYDCEGKLISCVETLSEIKYIVEPREGILSDDEIMQYAPESKAASQIRLKRGFGDLSDMLLVHESLPWLLGLYYVILLSISLPILFNRNLFFSVIILVLFIVPILYAYRAFNLKTYRAKDTAESQKRDTSKADKGDEKVTVDIDEEMHLESLKQYEVEINNLKVLFEVKEDVARQLVAKKFKPPQITYDRFILMIDKCNDLFYSQADTALNIIKLAAEDTPRIRKEVENKIDSMKRIIDQIEDLTNELVINISTDSDSKQEVQVLLDDMEDLIGSVKDYKE